MKDYPIEREYLRAMPVPLHDGEWYLQVRHGLTGDWETKQHFTRDGLITAMESLREDVTDITNEVIGAEIGRQQMETDDFTKSEWMDDAIKQSGSLEDEAGEQRTEYRRAQMV